MFLNRAKSWLPRLSWWRGKQDFNQEEILKEKPEVSVKCTLPPKARWWSGRRLLEIIGWGQSSAAGGHSLFAGIPQHVAPHKPSVESPEHFQICFNFTRHLFDLCVVTLLCASSPAFRLVMDILGFGGPLKVWLHGFACFLVSAYGMYLVLWLVQEYLLQFACLYGFLQTLVLWSASRLYRQSLKRTNKLMDLIQIEEKKNRRTVISKNRHYEEEDCVDPPFVSGWGLKPKRLTEIGSGGSKGVTCILYLRWLDRNWKKKKVMRRNSISQNEQ